MTDLKQYILIRTDLKMRRGKEIAQGAHASNKLILEYADNEYVKQWLSGIFTKIALSVDNEVQLLERYGRAFEAGIPCSLIEDSGLTEFHGVPTLTSVAIGPGDPDKVHELTHDLKLR